MKIKQTKVFQKLLSKLITKGKITQEAFDSTLETYKRNPKDTSLASHNINCDKNKKIISIKIGSSNYKILINILKCDDIINLFSWCGTHREYEIIIKNKKNCKSIFSNCDEQEEDYILDI